MISFSKKKNFNSPFFWIFLTVTSLLGCLFTAHYFPRAFPISDLVITMNRWEALEKAKNFVETDKLGPNTYQQAASFQSDEEVKNFIELEAGGAQTLRQILQERYYYPYFWVVRHFQESNSEETLIYFSPDGILCGFKNKISETKHELSLTKDEALELVKKKAPAYLINLEEYVLVESSQEKKISGRLDHVFVYHNRTKKIGGEPYRLRFTISGNRITEINLSIKIPETFTRRYNDMRSTNKLISFIANSIMLIIYLFCICFISLFYLVRNHAIIIKMPFFAALIVSLLQVVNILNEVPLLWMNYDTALSKNSFLLSLVTKCFLQFLVLTSLFTIIFIVAESLTRKAFPHHPQLWQLWSEKAGGSIEILGRTLGGYLVVGIDLALVTATYFFASRYLGWWTPSETLYNPDILASYMPWFSSIAQSLCAGSIEECLFRAIPLAAAALAGKYFNKRLLFLSLTFVMQAIVFGAAHANYATQPAYARLIELIIPSFIFGAIYLRFGLLPTILSHFTFDVFWFSLPLFVSHAPGILLNRLLVLFFTFNPLLIVLYRRYKNGSWNTLPQKFYNLGWQPSLSSSNFQRKENDRNIETIFFNKKAHIWVAVLALLSAMLWVVVTPFKYNNLPLIINRSQALEKAHNVISKIKNEAESSWHHDISIESEIDNQHLFVWQNEQKDMYEALLKSYLKPATWKVRYAQFDGDVEKRGEEYIIHLDGQGLVLRVEHHIPEHIPGKDISLQDAREIAYNFLHSKYKLSHKALKEVSATPSKLHSRTDWTLTFNDLSILLKNMAQCRIDVKMSGDEIVDYNRYIFVPDDWVRRERQRELIVTLVILTYLLAICILLFFFHATIIKHWRISTLSITITLIFFVSLMIKSFIQLYLIWPVLTSSFITSEPYAHQFFTLLTTSLMQITLKAFILSIIAGVTAQSSLYIKHVSLTSPFYFSGISLGILLSALMSFLRMTFPSLKPLWPDYLPAQTLISWLSSTLNNFSIFVTLTCITLSLVFLVDMLTKGGTKNYIWSVLLSIASVSIFIGIQDSDSLFYLLINGSAIGLFWIGAYWLLIRFNKAIIPLIICSLIVSTIIQQMFFNAFPSALIGCLLSIIAISFFALWWSYKLDTTLPA